MFRRSRFSVRPNVSTAGRTAAAPQEAPSVNQEASETPKEVSESIAAAAVTDNTSVVTPSDKPTAPGDGNDQNGEGTNSSAAVQRRKRFSIKPKVAPGRPSTLAARTPKSPAKAVSETTVEAPGSDLEKPTTSSQTATTAAAQGLKSPRQRRPSEESKQLDVQPTPTLTSSDNLGPLAVPPAEDSLEQTHLPADGSKQLESTSGSQVKEAPSRLPDKVPPSLPDKAAIELSEKAKTLVSSKSGLSLSSPAYSLSRLLNNPSDLQRLAKAQKLRELLKQEIHKEKKIKKARARAKEYTLDPAKMTMRDLIRYLPVSNPMTSSLEDSAQENETVVPPSPEREESPERAQEPKVTPKIASPGDDEEEEEAEEEADEALMVPQVKVAEDGSLIIDEESLTVEVQRAKGPNPAKDRDPIFERGSTTTYSSFRKGTYSKPWSSEETDMFFLAVSMVGTDFSMICQLFPHRARSEIKNKFKKEERENSWRIDKAFRERRKLDIEYFSKLLEKILEVQKNRKKLKSLAEKNSPKKHKRKAKGKKGRKLSDVEEEDEEEESEMPDLEGEEGEKENEELCNEGGSPVSKPKKKRKRKNKQEASTEEPNDKTNKTGEKSNEQEEVYIPDDAKAAVPDAPEKSTTVAKETAIKPAKLSRGRAPKPVLPLGRKWGKKPPPPSTNANDIVSDKEDGSVNDGASGEQANKDESPLRQAKKRKSANDNVSSEEEDESVQLPTATRYGRVPKPIKPLTYPAKEDASETTPASPEGSTASAARPKPKYKIKRRRELKAQSTPESKKPKLVTLRASQSEYSEDENEKQWEEEEEEQHSACSSSKDGIAPVFVPASLRSPRPVISEVEETMEELDILANMPDVLGISQDALCPDVSCELAQNDTAESCEHQLDLLVDVIDFLSSEHTDGSEDKSYNEAAQTLLTIGNLAHLSQSAQNQISIPNHMTGTTSASVNETSLEEEVVPESAPQEESSSTSLLSATSGHGVTETSETVAPVELQNNTTDRGDIPIIKTSVLLTASDSPWLQSSPESSKKDSPQTRSRRLSKVKPKPNLGQASRAAPSKSQPGTPTVKTSIDTVGPELSQASETLLAAEDTPETADNQRSLKADITCTEVKLTDEPSGSQERSIDQVKSGATTSENLSHCFSDAQFGSSMGQDTRATRPASEFSDEKPITHVGTTESSCSNLLTSDSPVTESPVGQKSNIESAPAQESSDHPASCVTPVEELPVSQTEESENAPTHQTRKSKFHKVKPKPNLARASRTVHSKPQTTKDIVDKDADPPPNPQFHEKTILEVEAGPPCTTSPEKPSQSTGPASDLIPSLNIDSTLAPTEELSSADVGDVGQVELDATTLDRRASEKLLRKNFSETKFESSMGQDTRDTRPASILEYAHAQESRDHPASCVTAVEELPVSQKEESEVVSTHQTTRGPLQKVKPNLLQTSRAVRSKPQTTKDPVSHMQLLEKPSSSIAEVEAKPTCSTTPPEEPSQMKSPGNAAVSAPSLELCSTHKPTDVGRALDSSSEASEKNIPQRRQRFPKVKPRPNLGSSTRTTQTKPELKSSKVTSEQQSADNNNAQTELKLAGNDSEHLTPHCSLSTERLGSIKLGATESEKSLDRANDTRTSSDGIFIATSGPPENPSVLKDSLLENKRSEKPAGREESTGSKMSNDDKLEAGPASQFDCKQDLSIRATETNTKPTHVPTAFSDVQSSEHGSAESKMKSILPTNTQSTADPKESSLQPRSQKDSEAQSQDSVQQCSETYQSAAPSSVVNQSEPTDSSKSSSKAPQTRRGRLIKPKPNLGPSSQPPQQVQKTKQAQAEAGTHSECVDASISHKPVSELRPDIREPVEGAIEQGCNQNSPPDVAGPFLGCVTQAPDNPTQDASTPSTEATQSQPSLSIFPDMLPEQLPSDPDEPFFILSLTAIPVCSLVEVGDSACAPLPYLHATDASIQQQSRVLGESLAAAGDAPLSNTAVPLSMEESGETGLINVKDIGPDPAACIQGSIMKNPVDPHESTTVQPSNSPESVQNNDETEIPPTKQRLMGTRSGATRQIKTKTTRKKQASKTLTAMEAETIPIHTNTTQDLELPGPSVQPQRGSGDHVEKKTLGEVEEPEDSSSGTQTAQTTRGTSCCKRKPKMHRTAPSSDSPPSKTASQGPKVKTRRAAGKRPAPVTSCDVTPRPTPSPTPPQEETHLMSPMSPTQPEVDMEQTSEHSRLRSDPAPRTSQSTAEISASQKSDCMECSLTEEEPTSVSQYFLSDIFTEVEEG